MDQTELLAFLQQQRQRVVVGAELAPAVEPVPAAPSSKDRIATVPNFLSILGYLGAIAYLQGGSPWLAVLSILADEADGTLARDTGTASDLGGALDWGIDLTLTGLYADRLGILWTMPGITAAQAYVKVHNPTRRPLSVRAVLMIVTLARARFGRLQPRAAAEVQP